MSTHLTNLDWSSLYSGGSSPLGRVLASLVILLVSLLLRRFVLRGLRRTVDEPARAYQVGKVTSYAIGVMASVALLQTWLSETGDVGTWLGIMSAGVAIALRDPIVNMAGWISILVRRPFVVGDRIQVGDVSGDVVDIGPLAFSLLEINNWVEGDQSTGRIIHVPNGRVFQDATASYNQGFEYIWNELKVVVTFESDWQLAKTLLLDIGNRHGCDVAEVAREQIRKASQKYMIHYTHLTPIVWVTVVDSGVALTVRYLCGARSRRSSAHAVWCDILIAFAGEPHIDFAYPTTRMFRNPVEGKTPRPHEPSERPPHDD